MEHKKEVPTYKRKYYFVGNPTLSDNYRNSWDTLTWGVYLGVVYSLSLVSNANFLMLYKWNK